MRQAGWIGALIAIFMFGLSLSSAYAQQPANPEDAALERQLDNFDASMRDRNWREAVYWFEQLWPRVSYNLRDQPYMRAQMLNNYASALNRSGRPEDGMRAAQQAYESIESYRQAPGFSRQLQTYTSAWGSEGAHALALRAMAQIDLGDGQGAEQSFRLALRLGADFRVTASDERFRAIKMQFAQHLLARGNAAEARAILIGVRDETRPRDLYRLQALQLLERAQLQLGDGQGAEQTRQDMGNEIYDLAVTP